ncbi:MAG: polyprenyl synthetase family protein [Patescibacteria group bacterium]
MKNYLTRKKVEIENGLKKIEKRHIHGFSCDIEKEALKDPMFDLTKEGGKRLRPVLTYLIGDIFGEKKFLTELAIISEILHNATLIIDDIEDRSQLRRGQKCTYLKYGTGIALNAGNFWYFQSINMIYSSDLAQKQKEKLVKYLVEEMTRLHLGQAMDIFWAERKIYNVSWGDYQKMSEYKTGSMLKFAILTGGILSGLNQRKVEQLSLIAVKMGLAFQIRDDILDIIANNNEWGKKKDQDLYEGKLTSVIVKTLEIAKKNDRHILIALLKNPKKSEKDIEQMQAIINKYGSITVLQSIADDIIGEIKISGRKMMPDNSYRKIFFEICDYLVKREK